MVKAESKEQNILSLAAVFCGRLRAGDTSRATWSLEIEMTITPFLKNQAFEPELIRAMSIAFESACARLGLSQAEDRATEMVAAKIIQFAQRGENDPDSLCRRVLHDFNVDA